MIGGRLTMRAALERNVATAKDAWGGKVAPDYVSTGDPLACFVWSTSSKDVTDGTKDAPIETFRALFAPGADVVIGDEIAAVSDRLGTVIFPGRLKIMGPVQYKHTHVEADLRRIG